MAGRIAYWLIPDKDPFNYLRSIIEDLAAKYNGVPFDPHVTVYVQPQPGSANAHHIPDMSGLTIELQTAELEFTNQYTKACTIKLHQSEPLTELHDNICNTLCGENYNLQPHLSLFYGRMDTDQQQSVSESLTLPESILFETLRAIHIPDSITTHDDVMSWVYVEHDNE